MVCCIPTCAQGPYAAVTGRLEMVFWALWSLLGVLCIWEMLALLVFPFMSTRLGLRACAYRWTRKLGGGRRGHFLRDPRGVHWFARKCAQLFRLMGVIPLMWSHTSKPWRDSPVSMVIMHVWYCGLRGHSGKIAGNFYVRLFSF